MRAAGAHTRAPCMVEREGLSILGRDEGERKERGEVDQSVGRSLGRRSGRLATLRRPLAHVSNSQYGHPRPTTAERKKEDNLQLSYPLRLPQFASERPTATEPKQRTEMRWQKK